MIPSRSEFVTAFERRYHVRIWGEEGAPTFFFLHGWGDTSASFQFVVIFDLNINRLRRGRWNIERRNQMMHTLTPC